MTARWEQMENLITSNGLNGSSFTAEWLGASLGVVTQEATRLIQAYLNRMTRQGDTAYVLRRTGRTKGSVWHVGARTLDKIGLTDQAQDDLHVRWDKVAAALTSMARLNPNLQPTVQLTIAAMQFQLNQLEHLLLASTTTPTP